MMSQSESRNNTADYYLQIDKNVVHSSASNHVRIYGRGDEGLYVVIVPSLGRGVEDYTELYNSSITTRLVEAGYQVVLIQPRGIGKSAGDLTPENASMQMFAEDIKTVLDVLEIKRSGFIGHAFGNRLVRTYATLYPDHVEHLVLMASGGNFELGQEQLTCLAGCFNLALDDKERLKFIKRVFFADASDPRVWLNGWYPELAKAQVHASRTIDGDFFKRAGGKPFMLIQAAEDYMAPPDKAGRVLKAELGEQVSYVEIPGTGHALSSERPDLIAEHIIRYFAK